jgi:putative ABC transport system permease protein
MLGTHSVEDGTYAMDSLLQDIRYAIRLCVRTPGFTIVAILALALGIGANTAIFTIVNAVLIERLPFQDPDRLVMVWENNVRHPGRPNTVAPANFLRWQERATAFEQLAGFYEWRAALTGTDDPVEIAAQDVTTNFFNALGVAPMLGRTFLPDEGAQGRDRVAVLAYALWQRRFGGDPSIIGRPIQLNSRAFTVIGVMPPDVSLFVKAGSLVGKPPELWTPFAFTAAQREPRGRYVMAIARLKRDVPLARAQTEMDTIASGLTAEFPRFDVGWTVRLVPVHDQLSGELKPTLLVLSGAVAFVLLIACANVANLLLARGAIRQREIAIRTALGAARSRMVRQLLTESLVLGLAGGVFGLLVAQWSLDLLIATSPVDLGGLGHITLSYPVLAFTAAVSIATAIVCGFAPAFEGSRADVQDTLKDGARQVGGGVRHRRLRHAFVVAEIALAVVLLVGAGLMLRSFRELRRVNPGFDASNVLTLRVSLPAAKYSKAPETLRFFRDAVARIGAIPGVRSAGVISFLPLAGLGAATDFTIVGQPPPAPGQEGVVDVKVCDDGFFRTMNVPLLRGRLFTDREMLEDAHVVVINDTMAQRFFSGADPIGQEVAIDMMSPIVPSRIIGIVGDLKNSDLTSGARAMSFWPHPQLAYNAMTFTVRTASDPAAFAPIVEQVIHTIDKDQPVADVRTMDQWIARSLAQTRFSSTLLTVFAALALLLAAIGIYGVMSYAVSQRPSEIGIRLALGAGERDILTMMVRNGIRLAVLGLGIGVVLAMGLSRALASLLFETAGTDPVTFTAVVGLLGAVAVLASYLPARRAAKVAPVEALRHQ